MNKQTYSEKLRDPRWQKMRLEVMQRDEWKCKRCGDKTKTLNVHHRWYEFGNEPWDYPLECLVTLCEDCHQDESELREGAEKQLIFNLRKLVFRQHVSVLASTFERTESMTPEVAAKLIWGLLGREQFVLKFFDDQQSGGKSQ